MKTNVTKNEHKVIYIVIPVFNRIEFTKKCLLSLRDQSYKKFRIIVIDDGSTDGTSGILEKDFPEVHIIQGDGNLWWTKATNLGVKFALDNGAKYILTLNNDTILTNDFLEKMIYWTTKKPKALIGALALDNHTKEIVYGGEKVNWITANYKKIINEIPIRSRKGLHEVSHFPGRGLLIPSSVFKKIGLFDEKRFPHYAADYDFTHRAVRNGFPVYTNYDARIYIYPEESGSVELRRSKSIIRYVNHLFGIKGGGNLINFANYAWINCPKKFFLTFFIIGSFRRIFGYWKKYE